jgi:hypothetical protein
MASDALSRTLLQQDPNRQYVPVVIHEQRGLECLVQWAGFPTKADWTWQPVDSLPKELLVAWEGPPQSTAKKTGK